MAQAAYKTLVKPQVSQPSRLYLIDCERLEDVESISTDEIDNYVCEIRRHEQHEHYLRDELEEDIF